MSYDEYRNSKGKQWKSLVSKSKKQRNDVTVTVAIGLFEWNIKEAKLKPKRGKRMALTISNTAPYASILKTAVEKWRAYHCDCFNEEEDYVLLLENFKEALFLPGSYKEFFSLKRYRDELGKDYAKIVLYLCTRSDYNKSEGNESEEEEEYDDVERYPAAHLDTSSNQTTSKNRTIKDYFSCDDGNETMPDSEDSGSSSFKRFKQEPGNDMSCKTSAIAKQIMNDEVIAREMQMKFEEHDQASIEVVDGRSNDTGCVDSSKLADIPQLAAALEENVDKSGQFFLVIRRGITFQRLLLLWQRECKKSSPEKIFRVKYIGERGIDSGALSKECLTKAISDMGSAMFPNGAPVDSVYNIHNGQFKSCGEIVATSVAQGGPAPHFLHENVFKMLVNPNISVTHLDPEEHLTENDRQLISAVKKDVNSYQDVISESGYTGIIDENHKDDIVGTMVVNIVCKRLLYLKEFAEGLKLFGLLDAIRANPEITKPLFVADNDPVDANYLFSLMCPQFSAEGSTKRVYEDQIMDNLQDFLFNLEDEAVTGYAQAIAWAAEVVSSDQTLSGAPDTNVAEDDLAEFQSPHENGDDKFEMANLTPAGVFGWLSGQQHKPLNGIPLAVTVEFDHECMSRNPKHTVCFPTVSACSRVITFPVAHVTESTQFRNIFLLAFCKGGSFDNP